MRSLKTGILGTALLLATMLASCRRVLIQEGMIADEPSVPVLSFELPISGASNFVSIADDPVRARQLAAHVETVATAISATDGLAMKLERALRGLGGDAANAPQSPEPALVTASEMLSMLTNPPPPRYPLSPLATPMPQRSEKISPMMAALSASIGTGLGAMVATMDQEADRGVPAVPAQPGREHRMPSSKPKPEPVESGRGVLLSAESAKPGAAPAKPQAGVVAPSSGTSDAPQWLGFSVATPIASVLLSDPVTSRRALDAVDSSKGVAKTLAAAPASPAELGSSDRPGILLTDGHLAASLSDLLAPKQASLSMGLPLPLLAHAAPSSSSALIMAPREPVREPALTPSDGARPMENTKRDKTSSSTMDEGLALGAVMPPEFDAAQFPTNRGLELGVDLARALVNTDSTEDDGLQNDEIARLAAQVQWKRDELDLIYQDMIDIALTDDPEATPTENHSYALCMTRALAEHASFETLRTDREAVFDELERDGTRGVCTAVALDAGSDHPDARILEGKWNKRQRRWMAIRCAQDAVRLYGTNLEAERKTCECLHALLAARMSLAELLRLDDQGFADLVDSDAQLSACLGG